MALVTDFHFIAPHLGHTLVELFAGFAHRRVDRADPRRA